MQELTAAPAIGAGSSNKTSPTHRPDRPCDACRRRKSRCVFDSEGATSCVMCTFHNRSCTFVEEAAPRKRPFRQVTEDGQQQAKRPYGRSAGSPAVRKPSDASNNDISAIEDYAKLQGESLLKKTLGLQSHRHASYIGRTGEYDGAVLQLRQFDQLRGEDSTSGGSFRKVADKCYFLQTSDWPQPEETPNFSDVDEIEQTVAPHGEALIRLYFRIVHPSFPILHKKVYLEKYGRTHREFSPPLLAAVYITALNWWTYSAELATQRKPDVHILERLALRTLHELSTCAKLSTVQAGLLLLQQPNLGSWSLTCLVTGIAQDLGLHLDCSDWRIPAWERGLRKRIAWAVYMQDKWSALKYSRPSHISSLDWEVKPVTSKDFPESAADEDDEDGSTEVEKGRSIFSAIIALSKMVTAVIEDLYSAKAESEIAGASNELDTILSKAKPIQLRLKTWYTEIPETLRVDVPSRRGKLNSIGYLHLAYFAAEISIHRKIISSISHSTDPYMIDICRSAGKARLLGALDFFDSLRPEQLQSFWYFASSFNIALIGTFAGLCMMTSLNWEEMKFYHTRLQEFKWTLKVRSKGHDFLERANTTLFSAVGPLLRPLEEFTDQSIHFPMMRHPDDQLAEDQYGEVFGQFLEEMNTDYMYPVLAT